MWRNNQVWLKVPVLKTGRSATARGFESLFLRHYNYNIAEWSSLVARRAHNPKVVGSNPSSATKWSRGVVVITSACHAEDRRFEPGRDRHFIFGFVAQSVEQRTENPRVDGSIPVFGTNFNIAEWSSWQLVGLITRRS